MEMTGFAEVGGGKGQATMTFRHDFTRRRASVADVGRYLSAPSEAVSGQACEKAARRQGFDVRKRVAQEDVADRYGAAVARRVTLKVARDGARFEISCTYDFAAGTVSLATP
jgi:hypothetical protein